MVGTVAMSCSGASSPVNRELAEKFLSRGGAGFLERSFLWMGGVKWRAVRLHSGVADRRQAVGG